MSSATNLVSGPIRVQDTKSQLKCRREAGAPAGADEGVWHTRIEGSSWVDVCLVGLSPGVYL